MNIKLKDIYFGRADGLQESEEECFENLFYKGNQKYDLLCQDVNKFIISGKKGTGKTILAKYFEKEMNKQNIPTETLNKRQIILNSYLEKGEYNLNSEERTLFVEFTILKELSTLLLKHKKKLIKFKNILRIGRIIQALKVLEEFVNKRYSSDNFSKNSFEYSSNEGIEITEKIGNKNCGAISKCDVSSNIKESYVKNPYYNIIDRLKKNLFYLLKLLPVNIIFDDLDELEVKIDGNKEVIRVLIAFIEVANQLNVEIRKNRIKNSRIIILMRSDIIKVLNENSSNLNKIISDSEIRLNWIKRVHGGKLHPLMDLIVTKIKKSNNALKDLSNDDVVNMLFPVSVNGVPVMDHMLNCSFGRPRDIINMLNIIKSEYPDAEKFEADLFKDTQQEYSTKFIDELTNELSTHYESEVIEEAFNIIRYINKKTFTIDDIEETLSRYKDRLHHFRVKEEYADFIYKQGIAGNTWKNSDPNTKRKYNFSWKYREDGFDTPDYTKRFYVHLALRKSLIG